MADNNDSEPVATASHKHATKTDVIINTLIENESRRKTCSPDMVAKMLDEGLNAAGYESDLHPQYIKEMQISKFASLEAIMKRNGFEEIAIIGTRIHLEEYWIKMREILAKKNESSPHKSTIPSNLNATKILNIASPIVSSVSILGDYKESMERVKPYVDQKLMSEDAARDYAVTITESRLEQNATMGLSNDLGNARIGQWVKDHPEIPNQTMQELGLGGVREMQKLMAGPDLES